MTLDGRSKELFISGGENVYPRQVEAVYEAHPAVREIAVVGVPDPRWGEVGCAYLVLAAGRAARRRRAHALRARAARRRSRCRSASSRVAELPRTASGKVQKHRLG